jgi:iron complex outermembrane receptor protein
MSYVGATKGFRSGGFNVPDVGSQYESYDQEEIWSYEAGLKSTFLENRLVVNGAAYYMDIENMQVDEAISYLETYTTNAAEASGYGFELDGTARLFGGLSATAGFGYNHIEFDRFQDALGDYKGNMPSYAPEYTFNIGAQYRHGSGFYAGADLIGYGKMYLDHANAYSRDAYRIVNAKTGYETERFDVYLYGKNIFDEGYDLVGYSGGYGIIYSEPGEIGLQLAYRF